MANIENEKLALINESHISYENKEINKVMLLDEEIFSENITYIEEFLKKSASQGTLLLLFKKNDDIMDAIVKQNGIRVIIHHLISYNCSEFTQIEAFFFIGI